MKLSVVVPTHARPQQLKRCLGALAKQTLDSNEYEVIVVDDGHTLAETNVGEWARAMSLTILSQNRQGPAAARNAGARSASGQILAFTDDDCAPQPDWLQALTAPLRTTAFCMAGGQTINQLPNNLYAEASQLLVSYLYEYFNTKQGTPSFFTSNNIALTRDDFFSVGGFDETFPLAAGEDREFCHRWLLAGGRMRYVGNAVVHHFHRLTLRTFYRQHRNYGRGAYHFHRARARSDSAPLKIEPLSFYTNLVLAPYRTTGQRHQASLALLLLLSQFANTAGYFAERFSN